MANEARRETSEPIWTETDIQLSRQIAAQAFAVYQHQQRGNLKFLEMSIGCMEIFMNEDCRDIDDIYTYSTIVYMRHQQTGDLEDLEKAIRSLQVVIVVMPEDHPDRAVFLNNLGNRLSYRYEQLRNLDDLEEAIRFSRRAIATISGQEHPNRGTMLNNLGNQLTYRYQRTNNLDDLNAAIENIQAAIVAIPEGHSDRVILFNNVGIRLCYRYERLRNLDDLEEAIKYSQRAIAAISEQDHPNRGTMLNNLGDQLTYRYQRTDNLDDLNVAIENIQAAIAAIPGAHPNRAMLLNNVGIRLCYRYQRIGNLDDLGSAIKYSQKAIAAISGQDHPNRGIMLSNLGSQFSYRYQKTGNIDDLDAAIGSLQAAISAIPEGHLNRAFLLNDLGNQLSYRYKRIGDLDDLEAAIRYLKIASAAIPSDDPPNRAITLFNLGNQLNARYERFGDINDLEAAIGFLKAAVDCTPKDDTRLIGRRLNNLACLLSNRYKRIGNFDDLEGSIQYLQAAIEKIPGGDFDRVEILTNLGNQLNYRYEQIGPLNDLEAAIRHLQEAIATMPNNSSARASILNNLANHLLNRYERIGNMNDFEASGSYSRAALEATARDDPEWPARISNLGVLLGRRHKEIGDLGNLEAAISYLQAAIDATPEDHPGRAAILNNLGNALGSRYESLGNLDDSKGAIGYLQAAIEATPEGHPNKAGFLRNLGKRFLHIAKSTGYPEAFNQSYAALHSAWCCRDGRPIIRLESALAASKLLIVSPWVERWNKAYNILHDAICLMPLVTSRSLGRDDQQYILAKLSGLAASAAAVSLEAGKSPLAGLRLLELGRNVTNSQLLDYRSDISDLWEQHPSLARAFDSLRIKLDSPPPSTWQPSGVSIKEHLQTQQFEIAKRSEIAKQLDKILQDIRQHKGFENFLCPSTEEHLLSSAQQGPIVVLNVTDFRSDAILVTFKKITSIPLPKLSADLVRKHLGTASDSISYASELGEENKAMRELLTWLWDAAVEPVLRALGVYPKAMESLTLTPSAPHDLPQIWWVCVGEMAKAPIHAAGKLVRVKGRLRLEHSTLQYCIPSYTPTIRALVHSRSIPQTLSKVPELDTLVVAMPTTPGVSDLDGAAGEASIVENNFRNICKVHSLINPTAETVLHKLPDYSVVHFACHGVSTANPADSHLLLQKQSITPDRADSIVIDKLRVRDIAAMKLPLARLAYLSACNTAHNTASDLADEVTHIASAFQLAGFSHVIGTLWPAQDDACKQMAMEFYSSLRVTGNIAAAYRDSILKLRAKKPMQPMYWAPFIHFGA